MKSVKQTMKKEYLNSVEQFEKKRLEAISELTEDVLDNMKEEYWDDVRENISSLIKYLELLYKDFDDIDYKDSKAVSKICTDAIEEIGSKYHELQSVQEEAEYYLK